MSKYISPSQSVLLINWFDVKIISDEDIDKSDIHVSKLYVIAEYDNLIELAACHT